MAVKYPIPMPNALVIGTGGLPTREWWNYWNNLQQDSGGPDNAELLNDITIISEKLGSPDGTPENIPPRGNSGQVLGTMSIVNNGVLPNVVTLNLVGDIDAPGNTYYYGTDSSGAKSFYTISSALIPSSNVTLTTDAGGQVTFDLSDVTPGTSGRLYGLAFDAKGRLSQQHTLDVVGVANRTTITGGDGSGASIGVDIAATYAGQTSITTLGTITTGTWNGSLVGVQYGGTGANLSATGGAGQYVKQSTAGGAFTVGTIPASDIGSGQALTSTNDTNVTITLGGTPASALLKATSITMGWTGALSIARGGTGQTTANAAYNALSPMITNGDIEIRAGGVATRLGVGSTGQVLGVSGGLPAWVAANTGTVTSVGLAAPAQFNITGSPVTGSGTLTLAWANQSANLVLAGPTSGASAAPTFRALVSADIPLPTDYISGLKLVWNSATSISVGTGSAVIPSTGKLEVVSSTLTLSSLSLSASTFYHVYLFDNAGTPTIECVTTAPASPYQGTARAKTGDTTRRYIGSILTDGSSNIWQFLHSEGRMLYLSGNNAGIFSVLSNGTATTPTSVSLSGVVPSTATMGMLRIANNSTAVNMSVAMTTTSGLYLSIPASSGVGSPVTSECPISSQAIAYQTGGASGNANIGLFGYIFER
jgi:hypothetical protein